MSIEEIEALAEKFGEKIDGVPLNIEWWANLVNKAYEQGRAYAIEEFVNVLCTEPFSAYVMDVVRHWADKLKEQK